MPNFFNKSTLCNALRVNYKQISLLNDFQLTKKDEYPHIFFIIVEGDVQFVLKKISRKNFLLGKQIFLLLRNLDVVLFPIDTIDGQIGFCDDDFYYILYKKVSEIDKCPSSILLADFVAKIHMINYNALNYDCVKIDDKKTIRNFFSSSKKLMEPFIVDKLEGLLDYADSLGECFCDDWVLSHGDLSVNNIMIDNGEYKLIDCETCFISYREFDIQHLMWNMMLYYQDCNKFMQFARGFVARYCNITGVSLSSERYKLMFCMDFVKVTTWLYVVSNDRLREDNKRQNKELMGIKNLLKTELFTSVLNLL